MEVVCRFHGFAALVLLSVVGAPALAAVTVQKGDTLFNISQRTGVSVAQLRAANNIKGNLIRVGQVLKTSNPKPAATKYSTPKSAVKVAVKSAASRYTVRSGDTLGKIAARAKISVTSLQRANTLSGTLIRVGQVLSVPPVGSVVIKRAPSLPPNTEARIIYTYTNVGPRDNFVTLSMVAQRNAKLTAQQFMALNHLSAPWVYPGMKVLLPQRVPVPIPPSPRRTAVTLSITRVMGIAVKVVKVDLRHRDVLVSPVLPRRGIGGSALVSTLARRSGATAVINGSYFHPRSFIPAGDLVVQGKRLSWGRIPVALAITPDNRAHIGGGVGGNWSGMETVVASGPQIVRNGSLTSTYSQIFRDPALFGRAQRSAIGLGSNRDLIMVSTNERLTPNEMGKVMARLGARDALLLDGGSSTGMTWNNTPILESYRQVSYGIGIFSDYTGRRYSRT